MIALLPVVGTAALFGLALLLPKTRAPEPPRSDAEVARLEDSGSIW